MRTFDYDPKSFESLEHHFKDKVEELKKREAAFSAKKKASSCKDKQALEALALKNSIASNAIEGISAASSGYEKAFLYIIENADKTELSVETILRLHYMMFEGSPSLEAGLLKTRDNRIVEYQSDGSKKICFLPVSAKETPAALAGLVEAFTANKNTDPLLLIPSFLLDLQCIHPFKDGNGRLCRLLCTYLFYKAGLSIFETTGIEELMQKEISDYNNALRQSALYWHEAGNDPSTITAYYLDLLLKAYK